MIKWLIMAFMLCFILFCTGGAQAEFYQWVDENGVTHVTNTPVAQDKDIRNIKRFSRDGGSSEAKTSPQHTGEWFKCDERSYRAGMAASERLTDQEEWSAQPVFDRNVRQSVNGFLLTLHFRAKLPDQEVKASGCSYGYQVVKVKTEEDAENRGRCRILDVSLGEKIMEPPRCRK